MQCDMVPTWFNAWMKEEGYAPSMLDGKTSYIRLFIGFLKDHDVADVRNITTANMEDYARYLMSYVSVKTGKPYSANSRRSIWSYIRRLLTALYEAEIIPTLPMPPRLTPAQQAPLPTLLSAHEMAEFLDNLDTSCTNGCRDRAMFELFYSSGLRGGEVARLRWEDVDLSGRLARIRQGKFNKDRMVPLTTEAVNAIQVWQTQQTELGPYMFGGDRLIWTGSINRRFKRLAKLQGIYRPGITVHQLRHACATHLIDRGAELRYVQELLGHASVETTVRYTKNQVEQLKRAYRTYHPRDNQLFVEVDSEYNAKLERMTRRIYAVWEKSRKKLGYSS